jgi:hypothetical protein
MSTGSAEESGAGYALMTVFRLGALLLVAEVLAWVVALVVQR